MIHTIVSIVKEISKYKFRYLLHYKKIIILDQRKQFLSYSFSFNYECLGTSKGY